ncbi:hypothetical protein LKL48_16395, partial [Listeria monocytogenes]|nr:hypothetical protein [Listeria monocytogenes]
MCIRDSIRAGQVRSNAWVRVADVDQAIKELKAAYQDALKTPNKKGAPASPSSCMTAADAPVACLLYTSDAADDLTRLDLGGRRIIQKKKKKKYKGEIHTYKT